MDVPSIIGSTLGSSRLQAFAAWPRQEHAFELAVYDEERFGSPGGYSSGSEDCDEAPEAADDEDALLPEDPAEGHFWLDVVA